MLTAVLRDQSHIGQRHTDQKRMDPVAHMPKDAQTQSHKCARGTHVHTRMHRYSTGTNSTDSTAAHDARTYTRTRAQRQSHAAKEPPMNIMPARPDTQTVHEHARREKQEHADAQAARSTGAQSFGFSPYQIHIYRRCPTFHSPSRPVALSFFTLSPMRPIAHLPAQDEPRQRLNTTRSQLNDN